MTFPSNPSIGDTHTEEDTLWTYGNTGWYRSVIGSANDTNYAHTIVDGDVDDNAAISATKLSFTQAGTGAVARTVDSKLKEVISVKDFGAVGDGIANDTAAIQAAVNYASTAGLSIMLCGTHLCLSEIDLQSGTHIVGGGSLVAGPLSGFTVRNHTGLLHAVEVSDVRIAGIELDISAWTALEVGVSSVRCIVLRRSSDIFIESNKFVTTGGGPALIGCTDVTIQGNSITSVQPGVSAAGLADGLIDCWVEWDIGARRLVIANNRIQGNGYGRWGIMLTGLMYGAQVMNVESVSITGNTISNTYYDGIWAFGRDAILRNAVITGNTVIGGRHGIRISDAYNCVVSANSVLNSSQYGIEGFSEGLGAAASVDFCSFTGNTIHDAGQIGLYLHDNASNNVITGNVIAGTTAQVGLNIGSGTRNIVDANRVTAGTIAPRYVVAGNFADVTYTPTLYNGSNVTSSALRRARVWVSELYVYVEVYVNIVATAGAYTTLGIELPIAVTSLPTYSLFGHGSSGIATDNVFLQEDSVNLRANLGFTAAAGGSRDIRCSFNYALPAAAS